MPDLPDPIDRPRRAPRQFTGAPRRAWRRSGRGLLTTSTAALMTALLATSVLGGCFGPKIREFTRSPERFVGPRVSISQSNDQHDIIVYAPSPGYAVTREGLVATMEGVDLFITIRRPDPAFLYTQQIVEQRIATRVPAIESMRVFARTLDHDQKQSDRPYALAPLEPARSPSP